MLFLEYFSVFLKLLSFTLFNKRTNDIVSTNNVSKYGTKKDKNSILETLLSCLYCGNIKIKKSSDLIIVPQKNKTQCNLYVFF